MYSDPMQEHTYSDLWVAVVNERKRQGVTLVALGERSGLPAATLREYFSGRTVPTYPRVATLADALGIDVTATVTGGIQTEERAAA